MPVEVSLAKGSGGLALTGQLGSVMQESAQAALREQEMMMDTCPTGLIILRNRVFERCNPAAGRFLGYEPAELIGKSTRILFSDECSWRELGEKLYANNMRGGSFSIELELIRKDGERIWALLSGYIIDPTQSHGIFSVVDVTAQKKTAEALKEAKAPINSGRSGKSGRSGESGDFLIMVFK